MPAGAVRAHGWDLVQWSVALSTAVLGTGAAAAPVQAVQPVRTEVRALGARRRVEATGLAVIVTAACLSEIAVIIDDVREVWLVPTAQPGKHRC